MVLSDLIAAVKTEGGFDATDAQVTAWINTRYQQLVAKSRWSMSELALGQTTPGVSNIALPDNVIEVALLRVGDAEYQRIGQEAMWRLRYGNARLTGGGAFAPDWSSAGADQIELYPTPNQAVDVTALCATQPSPLALATDAPLLPADFHEALVDGAMAIGLRRLDERQAEADNLDARFIAAVTDLQRRKNSRVGQGPIQVQVVGTNF